MFEELKLLSSKDWQATSIKAAKHLKSKLDDKFTLETAQRLAYFINTLENPNSKTKDAQGKPFIDAGFRSRSEFIAKIQIGIVEVKNQGVLAEFLHSMAPIRPRDSRRPFIRKVISNLEEIIEQFDKVKGRHLSDAKKIVSQASELREELNSYMPQQSMGGVPRVARLSRTQNSTNIASFAALNGALSNFPNNLIEQELVPAVPAKKLRSQQPSLLVLSQNLSI